MKSILLILPYFGKWPIWFEAHLVSIAKNETVNWLIITDCDLPSQYPSNIRFVSTTLPELNKKVNIIVDAKVPLTPRKFCDLKPAYGNIFKEYIQEYDFWGFCDMDIIWGDIRKFINNDILTNYDIISSRKEAISGHFNLFRNIESINNLYKKVSNYQVLFEKPKFMWFDEQVLTDFIKSKKDDNTFDHKVYWSNILLNQERGRDSHQEYHLDRWLWEEGKVLNTKTDEEVMYLHFINWKKTLKKCEVNYNNKPQQFYISYSEIHFKKHLGYEKTLNFVKNLFNGYYRKEWRRIFRNKFHSYKKKIKVKFIKVLKIR